jgi:hypothetical protein
VLNREMGRQQIGTMKTEASGKPLPLDARLVDVVTGWHGVWRYHQDRDYSCANPSWTGNNRAGQGGDGRSHAAGGTPGMQHANPSINMDRYVQAVTPAKREA